jgi:acetoin utilization protein AcuB
VNENKQGDFMLTPVTKVMTKKLFAVPTETTVFEAQELMKEKRLRHLPVIDELADVVGMISQRDLLMIPHSKKITVGLLMSSPVLAVKSTASLRQTIFRILQNKISSVLVVDEVDTVLGIVTTDDMLWHLAHLLADEKMDPPFLSVDKLQTIGQLAQKVSDMGI